MTAYPILELHLEAKYFEASGVLPHELGPLDIVIGRGETLELELRNPSEVDAVKRILLAHDFDWLGLYLFRGRRVRWEDRHELRQIVDVRDPLYCWQCDERPLMKADHLHRIMPSILIAENVTDDEMLSRARQGCGVLVLRSEESVED